jgi:hypothetical protein
MDSLSHGNWNKLAILADQWRLDAVLTIETKKLGFAQRATVFDFDYFVILNRQLNIIATTTTYWACY